MWDNSIMKHTDSEIHKLTSAEIARQKAPLVARREEIVSERAEIYRSAPKSAAATTTIDPDERAAIDHARHLLNGSAPESLSLPPEVNRDRILLREQRGIEIALKILASKDLVARATEAIQWAEENGDGWRALCREIVLTAIKFAALEEKAQRLLEQCVDISSVRLPMANVIGGRPISDTSISDLTEIALADGVVTSAEVKKAKS